MLFYRGECDEFLPLIGDYLEEAWRFIPTLFSGDYEFEGLIILISGVTKFFRNYSYGKKENLGYNDMLFLDRGA